LKPRLVPLLRVRRESRLSASKGTMAHPLRLILERLRRPLPLSPRSTQPHPGPHPHHPLHLPHDLNYLASRARTAELVLVLVGRRRPARSSDVFWTTSIPLPQRSRATRYNDVLGSLVSFRGAADVGVKDHRHLEAVSRCSMPHRLPSPPPCLRPSWLAPLAAGARLYWRPSLRAPLPAGTISYFRAFGPAPLSTSDRPCRLSSRCRFSCWRALPTPPVAAGSPPRRRQLSPATPIVANAPRRQLLPHASPLPIHTAVSRTDLVLRSLPFGLIVRPSAAGRGRHARHTFRNLAFGTRVR